MPTPSKHGRIALLALLALACATPRREGPPPAPPPAEVRVETPSTIEVGREDLELASKNDEELFAIAQAAYAAGDFARAANAFGRIADLHPESKRHATALYDAGLAQQRLGEWQAALERFRRFGAEYEGPDAIEAAFREAECQYHLGALGEARAVLDRLAARSDLPAEARVRALCQRGVVEWEARDLDAAERSLRAALAAWSEAEVRERLDPGDAAQARYYLGEVYRARCEAIALDPAAGEARLTRALEDRSRHLLSAQTHYLAAIRLGSAGWAVAAGERIGALYDGFHAALVAAPDPPGLGPEERAAYRAELRRRTRVLVSKAISAYEQTLAAAQRTAIEGKHVAEAQAALDRMKALLREP